MKHLYKKYIKTHLLRAKDDILNPGNNPKLIAFSMAMGIFTGIFIPIGLQIWFMAALLFLFRFNIAIATFTSLISNPFTVLPIYYAGIKTGEYIINRPFPWELFDAFIEAPGFDKIVLFGTEGMAIFLGGLFVLAISFSTLTYLLSFKITEMLRGRHKTALIKKG